MFPFLLFFVFATTNGRQSFEPFQDTERGEFGFLNEHYEPCLLLKFNSRIYNLNLNGTDIATELADFSAKDVHLSGYCALPNEVRKHSQLQADWSTSGRRKTIRFEFREAFVSSFGHQMDQLQWQLHRVTYIEHFKSKTIKFQSANESVVISAPIRQKFACKDRLNITLHNPKFKDMIVEFLPEIDVQPVNTGTGFGSNVYLCERTRRRTLSESFQSQMTIFSGIVLGLSSVGTLVGYSFHRQLKKPAPRETYNEF